MTMHVAPILLLVVIATVAALARKPQTLARTNRNNIFRGTGCACLLIALAAQDVEAQQRSFTDAQICRAAIAAAHGHPAKIVKVLSQNEGIIEVSYLRPVDAKQFFFWCKIEDNEILWTNPFIDGWAKNLRIYYEIDEDRLLIRVSVLGEVSEIESFSRKDF